MDNRKGIMNPCIFALKYYIEVLFHIQMFIL
jgi:hypothetical protein